ncbi:MAG: metallophosphoesterase, partial [Magnetococcales bacterium]|nr:metallophosphoesterase [Magnetococcales bacterium]
MVEGYSPKQKKRRAPLEKLWRGGIRMAVFAVMVLTVSPIRAETALECQNSDVETLTLAVIGDTRTPYEPMMPDMITDAIAAKPDLFIHLGDMVRDSRESLWRRFDREEGRVMTAGIPFLPVLGNHEYRHLLWIFGDPLTPYFERFPFLNRSRWYSWRCGELLRVLVLDSEERILKGEPQRLWLEAQLATPFPGFTLIAKHTPLITGMLKKRHNNADDLLRLLTRGEGGRIHLVMAGHVHNYERFLKDGITHITSGGGGSPAYRFSRRGDDLYIRGREGLEPNYQWMRLEVSRGTI